MANPRRLNFKHLRYFLEVAREGSIAGAAKRLFVSPQTVSSQIQRLEASVGHTLFERAGRGLALTPDGEVTKDYASAIFALGEELAAVFAGKGLPRRLLFRVGVTEAVPKLLAARVIEPVVAKHRGEIELVCVESAFTSLIGIVAAGKLDALLCELPVPPNLVGALQGRELMSSGTVFLATRSLAAKLHGRFPNSLDGAPFLTWSANSHLGQALELWFAQHAIAPRIIGRFDDSALMKSFAARGLGIVAAPAVIEADVRQQYGLHRLGRTDEVRQPFFLIRPKRHRNHPLVHEIESGAALG